MRRKSTLRVISLFCTLLVVCGSNAQAQSTYKVINMRNDTITYTVPSDFPVKQNTGDAVADENDFIAAFTAWNKSAIPIKELELPTIRTSGIKSVYFEITAAEFSLFTASRKAGINAQSQLYKILP